MAPKLVHWTGLQIESAEVGLKNGLFDSLEEGVGEGEDDGFEDDLL